MIGSVIPLAIHKHVSIIIGQEANLYPVLNWFSK